MGDTLWTWVENIESTLLIVRVADNAAAVRACARGTVALSKVMGGVHIGVVGGASRNEMVTKDMKAVATTQGVSVMEYPDSLRLNQVCNVRMYRGVPRGRLPDVMVVSHDGVRTEDLCSRAESQQCLVMMIVVGNDAMKGKNATCVEVDFTTKSEEQWGSVF